jgi:hypothetical protein
MAFSGGHALDSKQILEQLHDDSDSITELGQDLDIDIFDRIDPDAEISGPGLSDSCNSDDDQVNANVGGGNSGNEDGGCCSGGYNDEDDDDDEEWALWYEYNHDLYMVSFRASSGYKPPRSRQMPVSPDEIFMLYFSANLFEEIAAEITDI